MAVTQQLARLSADQLAACRRSAEELDNLCSFELIPSSDHLDLDWSPAPILRACEISHVTRASLTTLRRAFTGDAEINPAYREEHPVTALEPDAVADVAKLLGNMDPGVALAAVPLEAAAALATLRMPRFDGHPRAYLHHHLAAVRDFYLYAARQRLAIALWWD
ncbi:DUF1877 domain-containing protein [Micromonospora musae]|uniref:DUF1877 domain-containing protein n=1 Tax=Micromonospora musae TaxID=1894970 RepID=A0A3A9YK82_9ACTN|nr:DUF1877 domain-containing protein [Micromonospora musae]RKN22113.1 DUF1877 domain-containing protein [Micromonospora musae]RKN33877.1 DUF1877 domain-containing protein [Micromonospora musae]